jgi:hypothetical protein
MTNFKLFWQILWQAKKMVYTPHYIDRPRRWVGNHMGLNATILKKNINKIGNDLSQWKHPQ